MNYFDNDDEQQEEDSRKSLWISGLLFFYAVHVNGTLFLSVWFEMTLGNLNLVHFGNHSGTISPIFGDPTSETLVYLFDLSPSSYFKYLKLYGKKYS